jgi:hypothetical protein
MKLQCEHCGEVAAPASFRLEDGVPVFACGVCGAENRGDSTPSAPSAPPPARLRTPSRPVPAAPPRAAPTPRVELGPNEVKCPKCFHRQPKRKNCVRCGLDLRRSEQLRHHFEPDPRGNEEAYARGLELWAAVEASPQDPDAHETFLGFCTDRGLLELASRRYRERISDYPGEVPTLDFLRRVNERMEALAVGMLTADTWSKDLSVKVKRVKTALIVAAIVLAVLGVSVLAFVVTKTRGPSVPF